MVIRLSWLADSSWSRRTRFGTEASLAGFQNSPMHSIRKVATKSTGRVEKIGIARNSRHRSRSVTTIV